MSTAFQQENDRILAEIARRAREIPRDRDAFWQPSQQWLINERRSVALAMLRGCNALPTKDTQCLEIGFGSGGWLPDLIAWGVKASNLHGIEISEQCVRRASELLPSADFRTGNGAELPWDDGSFNLVITSTVFTSILDDAVRQQVAGEIVRVLAPSGTLLWYDFRFNNPWNPHVRGIRKAELRALFPTLEGAIRTISLLPPVCRFVAPVSTFMTALLSAIPPFQSHLLAVLRKHAEVRNRKQADKF